jgi:hypothetical protein
MRSRQRKIPAKWKIWNQLKHLNELVKLVISLEGVEAKAAMRECENDRTDARLCHLIADKAVDRQFIEEVLGSNLVEVKRADVLNHHGNQELRTRPL